MNNIIIALLILLIGVSAYSTITIINKNAEIAKLTELHNQLKKAFVEIEKVDK